MPIGLRAAAPVSYATQVLRRFSAPTLGMLLCLQQPKMVRFAPPKVTERKPVEPMGPDAQRDVALE